MQEIPQQPAFDTITEAVNGLQKMGYTYDFNLDHDCIRHADSGQALFPQEFQIDHVYRFEGNTDPGDENVVYAISSTNNVVKGVLVNAFGTYADPLSDAMVKKLSIH